MEEIAFETDGVYADIESVDEEDHEWGARKTLVSAATMEGAELTLAIVWLLPGHEDPLHTHANSEQVAHILAGECEFRVGDTLYNLVVGDTIRVPRGVIHNALCSGWEPLKMVVCQSSSAPTTQFVES